MYTKLDKYKHSVLNVIKDLHELNTGTLDPSCNEDKWNELASWLDWRINEAWDACIFKYPDPRNQAEYYIRILAANTFAAYRESF